MKHLVFKIIFLSFLSSSIPNDDYNKWNNIQNDNIWIGYSWIDTIPWCKSTSVMNYSVEEILDVIEDVGNYVNIFDSVVLSNEYDENYVHIRFDMPMPFQDREYIVKFNKIIDKKDVVYQFKSNTLDFIPFNNSYVRLLEAAGEWRLKSINEKVTKVTYIWNGNMEGNFPSWGLKRVWLKQGNEVLRNLNETLR